MNLGVLLWSRSVAAPLMYMKRNGVDGDEDSGLPLLMLLLLLRASNMAFNPARVLSWQTRRTISKSKFLDLLGVMATVLDMNVGSADSLIELFRWWE